jgi:hypothetical protein
MQRKLTIRLDEGLIEMGKVYAKRTGRSLSRLVADYFTLLAAKPEPEGELTPAVKELKGALAKADVSTHDYEEYLAKKHL